MSPSYFHDKNTQSYDLPDLSSGSDVRLSEDVIHRYVTKLTRPGSCVFDPFAGFGTVLRVAAELGRVAIGMELLPERVKFIESWIREPSRIFRGDSADLPSELPYFALALSSPPYMNTSDLEDPLNAYRVLGQGYAAYIKKLAGIYIGLQHRLSEEGHIVIQIQNLRQNGVVTPLAWDLAHELSGKLHFVGEEITTWDRPSFDYDHGYCLVYQRKS